MTGNEGRLRFAEVLGADTRRVSGGRSKAPADTLDALGPHLRRAGITRVAMATGLDTIGMPVAIAMRPLSSSLSVTQGKGLTVEAAKVSAIMEALEHYHAETIEGLMCWRSERELLRQSHVDTSRLAGRAAAYSTHERLPWILGHRLRSGAPCWVPFDLVHLDLRIDGPAQTPRFVPSSNGLASGNTCVEATSHALFEVVERHLTALFYAASPGEQASRRVDLTTVDDPDCAGLLGTLQRAGVATTVWDLSGLGVACYLCDLQEEAANPFRVLPLARGAASHARRGIALLGALCEAVQSRLTLISGARDDLITQSAGERQAAAERAREQRTLRDAIPAPIAFQSAPDGTYDTFGAEVVSTTESLLAAGLEEPVVVDLSQATFPISVVRVVAPGLRLPEVENEPLVTGRLEGRR